MAPDADHPTRTLWGDLCLNAVDCEELDTINTVVVACEGSR